MVKLRLFTENNFNYIESISLISVTRYIFEMSVWLELLAKDSRYGLIYYSQLIKGQREYWTRLKEQMIREMIFLKNMDEEEKELIKKRLNEITSMEDKDESAKCARSLTQDVYSIIDTKASMTFSIFAEQAKINGYGNQADLVRDNQVKLIDSSLIEIEKEEKLFNQNLSAEMIDMVSKNKSWKWHHKAKEADLEDEYAFIYPFTSKLIHAVPTSITTDHKNLEHQEIIFLLRYINIKIKDIIDLSRDYIKRIDS